MASTEFTQARKAFHKDLLETVLTLNAAGVASNADKDNRASVAIAAGIARLLEAETQAERLAGQTSGSRFEDACAAFVRNTFVKLTHLRPGQWDVHQVTGRNRLEIAKYEQFAHLVALDEAARANPALAAALGSDYTITPDVVVVRHTEADVAINRHAPLVDDSVSRHASLRKRNNGGPLFYTPAFPANGPSAVTAPKMPVPKP